MKRTLATIAAFVALSGGAYAATGSVEHAAIPHAGDKVRVTGCDAEDACRIDYRPSGVWIIRHRDRGAY